jgi:DNA repair protein RecN (Recombination protein N)
MLVHIQIHNLAIVSSMELDIRNGLIALTGETGAGKSILIDALGLALGDRADNSMIRSGSERAEVTAQFDVSRQPKVIHWLKAYDLDDAQECILRRSLNREGRSRAFINGCSVPLQQLQELGGLLVEIHGQHAHQSLLKLSHQRHLLDAYGGHTQLSEQVLRQYKAYQQNLKQLQTLTNAAEQRAARLDLLHFQGNELNELNLNLEELKAIEQAHNRLSNEALLRERCSDILSTLDGEEFSFRSQLSHTIERLAEIENLDESLTAPKELLDSTLIQLDEGLGHLRSYLSNMELDSSQLQELDERLAYIHDMARKHRVPAEQLPLKLNQINIEINDLEQDNIILSELSSEVESQKSSFYELAENLTKQRQAAAKRLDKEITQAMQKLGMIGGVFSVVLTPLPKDQAGPAGLEQVEFQVSANPGMPLLSLNKIASGGELSRISLAIQVATIRYGNTPSLVFDEVDVGIGGGIAEIVGQMLRKLSASHQILCVTHLPQVAAQATHHYQVKKTTRRQVTQTTITPLEKNARIQEIARMLGGVKITEQTLAHAQEMISLASDSR